MCSSLFNSSIFYYSVYSIYICILADNIYQLLINNEVELMRFCLAYIMLKNKNIPCTLMYNIFYKTKYE